MNKHYHEQITYDNKKENWLALLSILLIPMFLFFVGVGVVSTFKLPVRDDLGGSGSTGIESGIGGGPGDSPTPTVSLKVSPSIFPKVTPDTATGEYLQIIQ